jgi:hypothetical protein
VCLCTLCADRFLRSLNRCEVFRAYCRERDILAPLRAHTHAEAAQRWITSLGELPDDHREQIEWEQAAVDELSSRAGIAHLLAASGETDLFPVDVPDRGPLALWFLLRRPEIFREVFFHHEHRELDVWHAAMTAPGARVSDPDGVAASLAEALDPFFGHPDTTARPCTVAFHQLRDVWSFVARGTVRHRLAEAFAGGEPRRQSPSRAVCLQFAYYPQDGTVMLQAPPGPADVTRSLLGCFGRHTLGCPLDVAPKAFALDRLKLPFHPLPDADDMELVRVKTLHLRYPERAGRRQLNLQTLTSDEPWAMEELLRTHVSDDTLTELRVAYAELQVRLRVSGRSRNYLIRLWPDRCDVGQGLYGDRLLACLRRWGL